MMMTDICFVTGGAGFIGGNFVHRFLKAETATVVNIDKMTYAACPLLLEEFRGSAKHRHEKVDVADRDRVMSLFRDYKPRCVVHFAGESHVDRSIADPVPFLHTNILGTYTLLEAARSYYRTLSRFDRADFRFVHVSTDEVYGSLEPGEDRRFDERSPYDPGTPYAASKAASDHLVRSWHKTYGLPTLLVNCSNNYGPRQSPEKLVPKTILRLLRGEHIPVYGDGMHVRDWLYVDDCCEAILHVLKNGQIGHRYNIGGGSEKSVLDVVDAIRTALDGRIAIRSEIRFETDRLGNDRRYALDTSLIETELSWRPTTDFEGGIRKTVQWYLARREWIDKAEERLRTA